MGILYITYIMKYTFSNCVYIEKRRPLCAIQIPAFCMLSHLMHTVKLSEDEVQRGARSAEFSQTDAWIWILNIYSTQ